MVIFPLGRIFCYIDNHRTTNYLWGIRCTIPPFSLLPFSELCFINRLVSISV